jgi:adenylosuccinate lyase
LDSLGLDADLATNQILPYDNWIHYLDHIRLANSVLTGFTQDVWRYISDGYLKQRAIEGEIGSSTMPHKVNPIDFENAEGNLGIANALLVFYSGKLPISRLQRDLSDSTVRRTFGVALGHTLLAWNNILRGLSRVEADEAKIRGELNGHWEVVGEGAQSILRAAGWSEAYETLMALTRGRNMTETEFKAWAAAVEVDEGTRSRLMKLSPESYIGLAVQLTDSVLESGPNSEATPARRPE